MSEFNLSRDLAELDRVLAQVDEKRRMEEMTRMILEGIRVERMKCRHRLSELPKDKLEEREAAQKALDALEAECLHKLRQRFNIDVHETDYGLELVALTPKLAIVGNS